VVVLAGILGMGVPGVQPTQTGVPVPVAAAVVVRVIKQALPLRPVDAAAVLAFTAKDHQAQVGH
jgi:hypothetical protein